MWRVFDYGFGGTGGAGSGCRINTGFVLPGFGNVGAYPPVCVNVVAARSMIVVMASESIGLRGTIVPSPVPGTCGRLPAVLVPPLVPGTCGRFPGTLVPPPPVPGNWGGRPFEPPVGLKQIGRAHV